MYINLTPGTTHIASVAIHFLRHSCLLGLDEARLVNDTECCHVAAITKSFNAEFSGDLPNIVQSCRVSSEVKRDRCMIQRSDELELALGGLDLFLCFSLLRQGS